MKTYVYWILALLITLIAAVYQRLTGPTYPARVKIQMHGAEYQLRLPRSADSDRNCLVKIQLPDTSIKAVLQFKRYPTGDEYTSVVFQRQGEFLVGELPMQPPAGKLTYYVQFVSHQESIPLATAGPVIIRFKGHVPAWVLLPHILFMFFAMLLSNLTGLFALDRRHNYRKAMVATLLLLFAGGLILGPVVQKYAFGQLWTGFPFGYDLTDNKTLIAFVFWVLAWLGNRTKDRRWLVVLAAVIQILVYSVPHSAMGSELNYETGKVVTGWILLTGY